MNISTQTYTIAALNIKIVKMCSIASMHTCNCIQKVLLLFSIKPLREKHDYINIDSLGDIVFDMNSESKRCYKTVKIEKVDFKWNQCFVYKPKDWSYRKLHSHKTLHYLTFAHLSVTKMALEILCCLRILKFIAFWISVSLTTFKLLLSAGIPIYCVLCYNGAVICIWFSWRHGPLYALTKFQT